MCLQKPYTAAVFVSFGAAFSVLFYGMVSMILPYIKNILFNFNVREGGGKPLMII